VQWGRLSLTTRVLIIVVPAAVAVILVVTAPLFGAFVTVLLAGSGAATLVYAKNRTDRHNAAVDRGEIRTVPDPHLRRANADELDVDVMQRLYDVGFAAERLGRVQRFDGGWLIQRRSRTELAVVLGDDGGTALYDQRSVTDLRAASEYRAGRGREPSRP
jgi:hypothetical protein